MDQARALPIFVLSIAVTTFAVTAHAQPEGAPSPNAAADKLWEEAGKAMDAQDYATACPKIEEVVRLRPDGLGAKIKLAKCYEGAGRLASAWSRYVLAESLAEKANQADRRDSAHARVEALKPMLARLTIIVPDAVRALAGIAITLDGKVVEPAQWGATVPVDKGRHVIVVTATDTERVERAEEIDADGVFRTITIAQPTKGNVMPPAPLPEPRRSVAPAVVLGVVAAAGIGLGIGFQVVSSSNNSSAASLAANINSHREDCIPNVASYAGPALCGELQSKINAGNTYGDAAIGAFVAGGAAAAGMVLYLLLPSPRAKTAAPVAVRNIQLAPMLGTGNGLLVSGQF